MKKALLLSVAMVCLAGCGAHKGSMDSNGCGGGAGSSESAVEEAQLAPNVEDRVFFAFDSSALSHEAQSVLMHQAQWLKDHPSMRVTLEGHCDLIGTREYNLALGERRANAAKNFLVTAGGVPADRIGVVSYGKERPVAMGMTEEDHARNRRSVTVIVN